MKKYFLKPVLLALLLFTGTMSWSQEKQLSLSEALALAANGNKKLQIQLLENRKSEQAVKEARTYLLPNVSASAGYTIYGERPVIYLRNESADPKLNDVKFGGRFAFDGAITATYPLVNEGLKNAINVSAYSDQIKKRETKAFAEQLAKDITELYLSILLKKEQMLLLQQSLQRNERALKDSRSLFLQGKNLKTDTLSNYIAVQNLKASITALENNQKVLGVLLKQMTGLPDSLSLALSDSLSAVVDEDFLKDPVRYFANALNNRKDVQIQKLQVEKAKEQLQQVRAGYKPQLSAIAQYQFQSQADDLKLWNYQLPRTSFAGLRVTIPIYSGRQERYKMAQSKLAVRQNELALEDLEQTIKSEFISLAANLQDAYTQWQIQKQNVHAAQVNYTMMTDRYSYGLGSRLELADAELALTKAKLDELQAIYTMKLFEVQLKKATGSLGLY